MWSYTVVLCVFTCNYLVISAEELPTVRTNDGVLQGRYGMSRLHRQYVAFEGIPFAKPPVGKLRFEAPQFPEPWSGVLKSHTPSVCLQYPHNFADVPHDIEGEEDCLYLNVYTPNLDKDAKLDVLVHIHGGAFMFGAGIVYSPEVLLDRDVIFVTLNYRLGPFGFLSTEDDVVPGNNGMKDQSMALKWIHNNIHLFGGNPESVTITGLSAGGASVHLHYFSPLSRGLFKQGISMSGTVLNPWPLAENNRDKAKKLASLVGCETKEMKSMVACMKQRPAYHIVEQVPQFLEFLYNPFSPFGVVVEKGGDKPFLAEHPARLLKGGKVLDVPWLTSVTSHEGLYPAGEFMKNLHTIDYIGKEWNRLAPHILDYNYTVDASLHAEVAEKAKHFYLKGKPIHHSTFNSLVDMMSDRLFVAGAVEAAIDQARSNRSPVYFYKFQYRGKFSLTNMMVGNKDLGVSHGDDAYYILHGIFNVCPTERPMTEVMLDMWTSFAKTGKPEVGGVKWEPVCADEKDLSYLEINSPIDLKVRQSNTLGNIKFWNNLPINEK